MIDDSITCILNYASSTTQFACYYHIYLMMFEVIENTIASNHDSISEPYIKYQIYWIFFICIDRLLN